MTPRLCCAECRDYGRQTVVRRVRPRVSTLSPVTWALIRALDIDPRTISDAPKGDVEVEAIATDLLRRKGWWVTGRGGIVWRRPARYETRLGEGLTLLSAVRMEAAS